MAFEGYGVSDVAGSGCEGSADVPHQSFMPAADRSPWASAEDGGASDTTGINPGTSSALEHVPERVDAPDESQAGRPPMREEHHVLLTREEFQEYVARMAGGVAKPHAGAIFNEIGKPVWDSQRLADLPQSEQPSYFVETWDTTPGGKEWVVSLPNIAKHLEAVRDGVRRKGGRDSKTNQVLSEVGRIPSTGAQLKQAHARGIGEFAAALPLIEQVQEEHGPTITRSDFLKLATTPDDPVAAHVVGRIFNKLDASVLFTDGKGNVDRVIPLEDLDSAIGPESNPGITGRSLMVARRILAAAKERERQRAAAKETPEADS